MPTPTKGKRLGGSPAHERLMLGNLATSLFEHGRITTTENRARRLRPFAERLITKAKRGDLHARRQVMRVIRDKGVVHVLFTEIGPRFATRPGGYTRITKVGPRPGDNAPMAVIELVEEMAASSGGSAQSTPQAAAAAAPAGAPETEQPEQVAADEAAAEEAVSSESEAESEEAESEEAESEEAESEEAESEEASGTPAEDVSAQADEEGPDKA